MSAYISSRLAALAGIRQVRTVILADRAAAQVDRAAAGVWQAFLRRLFAASNPYDAAHATRDAFRTLLPTMATAMHQGMTTLAKWGYKATRQIMRQAIPSRYLQYALLTRRPTYESRELREDFKRPPGIVELLLDLGRGGGMRSLVDPDEEPAADMSEDEKREAFLSLLFPPPPREVIDRIIFAPYGGRSWTERLEGATRTSATPELLSTTVATGWAAGKTPQQIAKDLLPAVDGVRSSARRIARTLGMQVAHGIQNAGWEKMGDTLVGYQILATMDSRTRPEHAARHGTVYYKNPQPHQHGYDEKPAPPLEADGTVAWNCRCHLAPVLAAPEFLTRDKAAMAQFTNVAKDLIPDPSVYTDWFSRASQEERQAAVGKRRLAALEIKGYKARWEDFIEPTTGSLLGLGELTNETDQDRLVRRNMVGRLIADRRAKLAQVSRYGFEMA